mmetsp:Transcript_134751/g.262416  ORF Transcript_134751/g.262416 Transcript_134751/m.262416 type:complete len:98 (-) Transcript_134751:403-696(-)
MQLRSGSGKFQTKFAKQPSAPPTMAPGKCIAKQPPKVPAQHGVEHPGFWGGRGVRCSPACGKTANTCGCAGSVDHIVRLVCEGARITVCVAKIGIGV